MADLTGGADGPIHVVILNWNRRDDTLSCLASLEQSTRQPERTWLVDQGSTDDSVQSIRSDFPWVDIIQTGTNTGFARGMNIGIQYALQSGAASVLLLNNDTIVSPSALERLVAQQSPGVGIVGPAIFYTDRPHEIWSIGNDVNRLLYDITGSDSGGKHLPTHPIERGFISGCAMLISRRALADAGLFDERFFMYYEDLDFCIRYADAGYRLMLAPDAHIWHRVSQSSGGRNSPAERNLMARSSGLYYRKYMHGWRIPLILTHRALSALRWTGRLALRRDPRALVAYWRGLLRGWFCPIHAGRD